MPFTAFHNRYWNFSSLTRSSGCVLGSGAVALAHLDGSGTDEAVCTMVQRVQELALGYPEGRIELQLIGGFTDANHYSEEVFYSIMSKMTCETCPKNILTELTFQQVFTNIRSK